MQQIAWLVQKEMQVYYISMASIAIRIKNAKFYHITLCEWVFYLKTSAILYLDGLLSLFKA